MIVKVEEIGVVVKEVEYSVDEVNFNEKAPSENWDFAITNSSQYYKVKERILEKKESPENNLFEEGGGFSDL